MVCVTFGGTVGGKIRGRLFVSICCTCIQDALVVPSSACGVPGWLWGRRKEEEESMGEGSPPLDLLLTSQPHIATGKAGGGRGICWLCMSCCGWKQRE